MERENKREERAWLDILMRCMPDFPAGAIRPGESPDFTVQHGPKRRSGIEMTRLTRKGPGREGSHGRFFPELTKESLQERIVMKEAKLPLYRKKRLRAIWLVIVVSGFSNSASFNIRNQVENWRIVSSFDRVLLLDLSSARVYPVSPPVQS